jgi:hypothetical protein
MNRLEAAREPAYNGRVVGNPLPTGKAMKLELTTQQEQAVQQGRPVEVVEPTSRRTFVVMARELYERVRSLLEGGPPQDKPAPVAPAAVPPVAPAADLEEARRIRLRELPTPPEVTQEVEQYCKKYHWNRREIEDQLKLQYYFGGQAIYVVRTPDGPLVIPIEGRFRDMADLRYVMLKPEERSEACYTVPSPWHDTVAWI